MVQVNDIVALNAAQLLHLYGTHALSPVEVMAAHLRQCEDKNPVLNAAFGLRADYAMAEAARSEERWLQGQNVGPLDGVPVLLKDSIKCIGFDYFHGSASYDGSPAQEDGPPAARIKEAGGLVFGKTTMPDYGMLAAGVSSIFGIVRNPWNHKVNTGGSSAGSAAAVAAGMAPLAVGTDIAGSVRLPSALCGMVGVKPSRGRIPHLQPSPIRAAGPMTRSVEDAGLLMSVLIRPDARDFESAPPCHSAPFQSLADVADDYLKGKVIGLMLDMGFGQKPEPGILALIKKQAETFEALGAVVDIVPTIASADPMEALYMLVRSRAYYELCSRPAALRSRILPHIGQWCRKIEQHTAHDLSTALFNLEEFKACVTEALRPFDYIISPSMTVLSFPADQVGAIPEDHFAHCAYQIPFNQTGMPALSINAGFIDGLPVGMQIAGQRFDDLGILKVARLYEQQRNAAIPWPMA